MLKSSSSLSVSPPPPPVRARSRGRLPARRAAARRAVQVGEELLGRDGELLLLLLGERRDDEDVRPLAEAVAVLGGIPSSSQITMIGSGKAKSSTRSISPRGSTASISSSAISWIRGRSASTMRGVNAFVTSRRRRRWSSPSFVSRCVLTRGSSGARAPRPRTPRGVSASVGSTTKRSSSSRTARTSSWRVTNQIGVVPSSPGWRKTGSCSRIAAYVS